ncbi:IS3 family transposase [Alkalihalophilus marmarensis]
MRIQLFLNSIKISSEDYIEYYDQERYQWSLQKMTPVQYRSHLLAA